MNRVRESLPIRHAVFLVHGEEHAITALEGRLKAALDNNKIIVPSLDDCFSLTETGAEDFRERPPPRLPADKVARLDWHNEASQLFLDINDALMALPDE